MKKFLSHISIAKITPLILLSVFGILLPQTAHAVEWLDMIGTAVDLVSAPMGWIALMVLQIIQLILWLAGQLLNLVVQYSVVDMAKNLNQADTVNNAWRVIRDICNMAFIFVLLYAAIQTILGIGKDTKGLIVKVVVVAILINFSLFFTKFVIDVSNILAMTFYDAIAPGALNDGATTGIANSLMEPLRLQTIMQATETGMFDGKKMIIIGIMGSLITLIAAFVFFAISIMFIVRFVVLIFVLILSPIAFVSFILPQTEKYRNQWWDALSGQAFFAPVYFLLTWVVIMVTRGLFSSNKGFADTFLGQTAETGGAAVKAGDVTVLMNFLIIIALLITSLVISKEWANKAGSGSKKLTSWMTGAAIGTVGWAGRNSVGRVGTAIGDNERMKRWTSTGNFAQRLVGKQIIKTGRGIGGATFDARGAGLVDFDAGKAGGKGGFMEYRKKAAESEEKFAKTLGPSEKEKAKAKLEWEATEKRYANNKNAPEYLAAKKKWDEFNGVKPEEVKKLAREAKDRHAEELAGDTTIKDAQKTAKEAHERVSSLQDDPDIKREKDLEAEVAKKEEEIKKIILPEMKQQEVEKLELKKQELELARKANQSKKDLIEKEIAITKKEAADAETRAKARTEEPKEAHKAELNSIKEVKSAAETRKQAYADSVEKSLWARARGYNYDAAAKIRKGKSTADEMAELAKKIAKDSSDAEPKAEEPPKADAGGGDDKAKT